MPPVATTLSGNLAIFFAARIPNRVRLHLDILDRRHRIVALNHQLANARAPFGGVVLNHYRKK